MSDSRVAARVLVRLDPGVNDPQGNAVAESLRALGFDEVRDVRVGRLVELVLEPDPPAEVHERVDEMCRSLLANPVIERWQVEITREPEPAALEPAP